MAVTIDDLPTHGALPKGTQRTAIAERIISILKRHAVPEVYGFVNGGQIRENPDHMDILRMWVEAGLRVGNHTFAHPNLNRVSAADYIGDIERNEAMLVEVAGPLWGRVFRYPTSTRATPSRSAVRCAGGWPRRAIRSLRSPSISMTGPGTMRTRGAWASPDPGAIQWLKQSFLQSAVQRLAWSEAVSKAVLGRHIKADPPPPPWRLRCRDAGRAADRLPTGRRDDDWPDRSDGGPRVQTRSGHRVGW